MSLSSLKQDHEEWLLTLKEEYYKTRKIKPAELQRLVTLHNDIIKLVYRDKKQQQMRMIDTKICTSCGGGKHVKKAIEKILAHLG